jgi:hypothetical protein
MEDYIDQSGLPSGAVITDIMKAKIAEMQAYIAGHHRYGYNKDNPDASPAHINALGVTPDDWLKVKPRKPNVDSDNRLSAQPKLLNPWNVRVPHDSLRELTS